jgi:Cof subfamily protein (haloacid dehalogenase superfamily)
MVLADVDGTLVTHDKRLTKRALAAVRELGKRGIAFAITSGRPPQGMSMLIRPLRLTTPLAAFNGGELLWPDQRVIERHVLPDDVVPRILELARAHGLDAWLYRESSWYTRSRHGPHVDREEWTVRFPPVVVAGYDDLLTGIIKLVGVSDDLAAVARCEAAAQKQFAGRVVAERSQPYYLDFTHPRANKGNVVRRLSDILRIPLAQIATIGDQVNDTLMFGITGLSIAMGNASDEVKRVADRVTTSCEDEGFANAIDRFVLGESAAPAAARAAGVPENQEGS